MRYRVFFLVVSIFITCSMTAFAETDKMNESSIFIDEKEVHIKEDKTKKYIPIDELLDKDIYRLIEDEKAEQLRLRLNMDNSLLYGMSSRAQVYPIDGLYANPYHLMANEAVFFIILTKDYDLVSFRSLDDDMKKQFMNDMVMVNYGQILGCNSVDTRLVYDGKIYGAMEVSYNLESKDNKSFRYYREGKETSICIQDKKKNTYYLYSYDDLQEKEELYLNDKPFRISGFLERKYKNIKTQYGTFDFTFEIVEEPVGKLGYDYWIRVHYDQSVFYDLKHHINYSVEEAKAVKESLKNYMEAMGRELTQEFPGYKFMGSFYDSWFVKGERQSRNYYSWVNYNEKGCTIEKDLFGEESKDVFRWYPLHDEAF